MDKRKIEVYFLEKCIVLDNRDSDHVAYFNDWNRIYKELERIAYLEDSVLEIKAYLSCVPMDKHAMRVMADIDNYFYRKLSDRFWVDKLRVFYKDVTQDDKQYWGAVNARKADGGHGVDGFFRYDEDVRCCIKYIVGDNVDTILLDDLKCVKNR